MGTLFIYGLFMVELLQDAPLERMDEIIYCVNAVSRVLEFLVAVCVVAYGTWESVFGEWSWMGASVIIIHSYFNVWLRAQSGWRSFLLRREAAKKISSLPRATRGQLRDHDDVCAICFQVSPSARTPFCPPPAARRRVTPPPCPQDMQVAVVTSCHHFFHGACLRKWLYVQDTCPMCHQRVTPAATGEDGGEDAAAQPAPAREDEAPGDGGAAARPREDGPAPGEPLGGVCLDDGTGVCSPRLPARPDPPAPEEGGAAAVPPPSAVRREDGGAQQPAPSAADPGLDAGRSRDSRGDHRPS